MVKAENMELELHFIKKIEVLQSNIKVTLVTMRRKMRTLMTMQMLSFGECKGTVMMMISTKKMMMTRTMLMTTVMLTFRECKCIVAILKTSDSVERAILPCQVVCRRFLRVIIVIRII